MTDELPNPCGQAAVIQLGDHAQVAVVCERDEHGDDVMHFGQDWTHTSQPPLERMGKRWTGPNNTARVVFQW